MTFLYHVCFETKRDYLGVKWYLAAVEDIITLVVRNGCSTLPSMNAKHTSLVHVLYLVLHGAAVHNAECFMIQVQLQHILEYVPE